MIHKYFTNLNDPQFQPELTPNDVIAVGDLHGNPINLLASLIEAGVFSFEDSPLDENQARADLTRLAAKSAEDFTRDDRLVYDDIIDNLTIHKRYREIMFIGDEIAERYETLSDYCNFKIFARLHQEKINFSILLSNHNFEWIQCFERFRDFTKPNMFLDDDHSFTRSMVNLQTFIENGVVTLEEIEQLYQNVYLPHLQVMTYSVNERDGKKEIVNYAHTPYGISLTALVEVYEYLVGPADEAMNFFTMIDAINTQFKKLSVLEKVHTLFLYEANEANPMFAFIWDRNYTGNIMGPVSDSDELNYEDQQKSDSDKLDSPLDNLQKSDSENQDANLARKQKIALAIKKNLHDNGYTFQSVHGHGLEDNPLPNIINTDSVLGKSPYHNQGERVLFGTNANRCSPQPEMLTHDDLMPPEDPKQSLKAALTSDYSFVEHNAELSNWIYLTELLGDLNHILVNLEQKGRFDLKNIDAIKKYLKTVENFLTEIPDTQKRYAYFLNYLATDVFDDHSKDKSLAELQGKIALLEKTADLYQMSLKQIEDFRSIYSKEEIAKIENTINAFADSYNHKQLSLENTYEFIEAFFECVNQVSEQLFELMNKSRLTRKADRNRMFKDEQQSNEKENISQDTTEKDAKKPKITFPTRNS